MTATSEGNDVNGTGRAGGIARPVSRRRLLQDGLLAGTAGVLAACAPAPARPAPATATTPPAPSPTMSPSAAATGSPVPSASAPAPSLPPDRDTSMQAENALRGDHGWDRNRVSGPTRAYLAAASVGPGEPLALRASGSGTVSVEWYRLGWYDGAGGRLLRTDAGVKLASQPHPTVDPTTGRAEAGWAPVLHTTAPSGVKSGLLLAVLRSATGKSLANVPIVLRPDPTDPRRAPVLFVSAACTWQAYNEWGGADFYSNPGRHSIPASANRWAVEVSFDRPYALDSGAGYLRRWELPFIRWMERAGRDVEYIADLDLARNPGLADGRRLIVMAGHPEYWSRPMRERLEAAVASGVNVAFLTANEVYWQTRLEDGPAGPATRIVCYKRPEHDPLAVTQPSLATGRWRDPPVNEPEAPLVGQMYGAVVERVADWVVAGHSHWLYEGTGLRDGDPISNLVGQEFDAYWPSLANPGTAILARSPVVAGGGAPAVPGGGPDLHFHNATIYTAQSGATVFAAGTFQWSWAVDEYGDRTYKGVRTPVDDRVARMTRNLFDRLGDGPLAP